MDKTINLVADLTRVEEALANIHQAIENLRKPIQKPIGELTFMGYRVSELECLGNEPEDVLRAAVAKKRAAEREYERAYVTAVEQHDREGQ